MRSPSCPNRRFSQRGESAANGGIDAAQAENDRIDAHKLARLGRVDPQWLHPLEHRSSEVRRDLLMLRARDALVAVHTELINTTRGLVKSIGQRLPRCSSHSFVCNF